MARKGAAMIHDSGWRGISCGHPPGGEGRTAVPLDVRQRVRQTGADGMGLTEIVRALRAHPKYRREVREHGGHVAHSVGGCRLEGSYSTVSRFVRVWNLANRRSPRKGVPRARLGTGGHAGRLRQPCRRSCGRGLEPLAAVLLRSDLRHWVAMMCERTGYLFEGLVGVLGMVGRSPGRSGRTGRGSPATSAAGPPTPTPRGKLSHGPSRGRLGAFAT